MNLAPTIRQRFFDNVTGAPLAGGSLYTYQAGTTTPQVSYQNAAGATNTNPVVLDANGYCDLWLDPSLSYKLVLQDANGNPLWTTDNVSYGLALQPWSATTTYSQGVMVLDSTGTKIYVSIANSNLNRAVTNATYWQQLNAANPVGNVRNYGATGNGTTDDSAAITAAFADLQSGVISALYFPAGTYYVNSVSGTAYGNFVIDQSATGASTTNNIRIFGDGMGVTQIKIGTGCSTNYFIVLKEIRTSVTFSGIMINDARNYASLAAGLGTSLLDIQNCLNATVDGCQIQGGSFYGIGVSENVVTNNGKTCDNLVIRNCIIKGAGIYGLEIFPKVASNNCSVHDNLFLTCGGNWNSLSGYSAGDSAAMKPGQNYTAAKVFNNTIVSTKGVSIAFGNVQSIDIYDNIIRNPGDDGSSTSMSPGIVLTVSPWSGTYGTVVSAFTEVKVRDNLIVWDNSYSPSSSYSAIEVNGLGMAAGNGPIHIEGNTIKGIGAGILIDPNPTTGPITKISITNNVVEDVLALPLKILSGAGAAVSDVRVRGNRFINNNPAVANINVQVTGSATYVLQNIWFEGNTFIHCGPTVLAAVSCNKLYFQNNKIIGPNPTNVSSVAIFNVTDSAADAYYIYNNHCTAFDGYPYAWTSANSLTPSIYTANNTADSLLPTALPNGTTNVGPTGFQTDFGFARQFWGTAAPTSGTYIPGDLVWNTAPTAGGWIGFICTTGGTPGTWKTFGAIGT